MSAKPSPSNTGSVTTSTIPGPGTLTIFLLFAVMAGMTWAPVRPFVYALLVLILADVILGHSAAFSAVLHGDFSGGPSAGGGGFSGGASGGF